MFRGVPNSGEINVPAAALNLSPEESELVRSSAVSRDHKRLKKPKLNSERVKRPQLILRTAFRMKFKIKL